MLEPPVEPMLAQSVERLPTDGRWSFEPKWDGYRCLVFRDHDEVWMQSRAGNSLQRAFPDVVDALREALPPRVVLDGELIVTTDGQLDFGALSRRAHARPKTANSLAREFPAEYVAFDLLALDAAIALDEPFALRREALVRLDFSTDRVHLTPATDDVELAERWFTSLESAGLDGVVGKRIGGRYHAGARSMIKIKHSRTADCVVAGLRWHRNSTPGTVLGSLLLGLYDEDGVLHHVGVIGSFSSVARRALAEQVRPLLVDAAAGHPWLGAASRDGRRLPGIGEWVPVRPRLVAEVDYERLNGPPPSGFRHNATLRRWRPDRTAESCTFGQLSLPDPGELRSLLDSGVV